nr:MAG TPA: hypothetical protein [Caudoviricetes sp.]
MQNRLTTKPSPGLSTTASLANAGLFLWSKHGS